MLLEFGVFLGSGAVITRGGDMRELLVWTVCAPLVVSCGSEDPHRNLGFGRSALEGVTFSAEEAAQIANDAAYAGDADEAFRRLERSLPGFGGLYLEQGVAFAWLTDLSVGDSYRGVLLQFARLVNPPQPSMPTEFEVSDLKLLQAKYDFSALEI
jgi:hypothetical protein